MSFDALIVSIVSRCIDRENESERDRSGEEENRKTTNGWQCSSQPFDCLSCRSSEFKMERKELVLTERAASILVGIGRGVSMPREKPLLKTTTIYLFNALFGRN